MSPGCGSDALVSHDLDRRRRSGLGHPLAELVGHRANPAERGAGDERLSDLHRSFLDENGGDDPAGAVELRLEHHAGGVLVGVGLVLLEIGHEKNHLEQIL